MKEILVFILVFLIASSAKIFKNSDRLISNYEVEEVKEIIALPKKFIIPSLEIETKIEDVGLDPSGRMDVPKNANQVAWYKYGPKPGETGSAVIAGHLDSKEGPAIFYKLSTIKIGDTIQIMDENNKVRDFVIKDKKIYKNDQFPIDEVFLDSNKTGLNLITCHGIYDKQKLTYNERLVVYAELKL